MVQGRMLRGNGGASGTPAISERLSRRSLLSGGLAVLLAGRWLARAARGAEADEADTSPQAREDAIRTLPIAQLTAESRRKLLAVAERPSIYRRLPTKSLDCDPALFLFLIRNPEVVVNIWQLMGVNNMSIQRVGPFLWKGSDGSGTTCDAELIYGTDNLHVMYCDGFYEGSLLKHQITGRTVLLMKSAFPQSPGRRPLVATRLDLFVQIDNTAADVVARTLSPWVGKVADANFHESCLFASKLSQTAEQRGPDVQRLADKLTNVEPPIREEFARLAVAVQQRAALREVGAGLQRR
jgi:hypothetical protein